VSSHPQNLLVSRIAIGDGKERNIYVRFLAALLAGREEHSQDGSQVVAGCRDTAAGAPG